MSDIIKLRAQDVCALIRTKSGATPELLYWGRDVPASSDADGENLVAAGLRGVSVVPLASADSWNEEPGLVGTFSGRGFSPRFAEFDVTVSGESRVEFSGVDDAVRLRLEGSVSLEPSGLLSVSARVTNLSEEPYDLDALTLCLPLPVQETIVMDEMGTWGREHNLYTHEFTPGIHRRQVTNCMPSDSSAVHGTCEPGTTWARGSAHLVHVAWSGNTRTEVESNYQGWRFVRAGEWLAPQEISLQEGESYASPTVLASCGDGLDMVAHRFHAHERALAAHPKTPRPVTINTWEAVGFHQEEGKLRELAAAAAKVGVERFVLDDGWFSTRRWDDSGLGDWWVAEDIWKDGLKPLADYVHGLGMQFGIWFEPESANVDSVLFREHPNWILRPEGHLPADVRNQQVINLAIPECYDQVFSQMCAVIEELGADYVKWDHNRELWEAGDTRTGKQAYHEMTLACWHMFDELHERFPELEVESCASGGGRIDLGMMERAQRVWGSDDLDPLERWHIHDGTDLVLPPEVVGCHIGKPQSNATVRISNLQTRAACSFLYHLGIEWDITSIGDEEQQRLAKWVAAYKRWRTVMESGTLVHGFVSKGMPAVRGLVAEDRSSAVYVLFCEETSPFDACDPVALPGLDPARTYRIEPLRGVPQDDRFALRLKTTWWKGEKTVELTGEALGSVGMVVPKMNPGNAVVITCTAV